MRFPLIRGKQELREIQILHEAILINLIVLITGIPIPMTTLLKDGPPWTVVSQMPPPPSA